jgi:hypothetical protein
MTATARVPKRLLVGVTAALGCMAVVAGTARADTTIDCSQPLTHSITLTGNASCTTRLTVGASNITINLNGFQFNTVFGPAIDGYDGYDGLTIENGRVFAQDSAIGLTNVHGAQLRNLSGTPDPVVQGGGNNLIMNSSMAGGVGVLQPALTLSNEHHDVISNDQLGQPGTLQLTNSNNNVIDRDVVGAMIFSASNANVVGSNTVTSSIPDPHPGITGTGSHNLLVHNHVQSGIILVGTDNFLFGNTYS